MTKQNNPGRVFFMISAKQFKMRYPEVPILELEEKRVTPLEKLDLSEKEMGQINMHPVVLSSVCGMVFGDGSLSIQKNYKNARIQMRHSSRQVDWFMWKSFYLLGDYITENSCTFQKPDGFQSSKKARGIGGETLGKFKVTTKADEELTKLYSIVCKNGKKTFRRCWLNHMNNYFLMVLWLDDGSLSQERQGVLSLNSTPVDQLEILAQYLKVVWKIDCNVVILESKKTRTNPEPGAITISDLENLEKLMRIIAPIVPVKSMLYKVCIYHQDRSRLQRWTSELKTLVREEWHEEIDFYYAYLATLSTDIQYLEQDIEHLGEDLEEDIVH